MTATKALSIEDTALNSRTLSTRGNREYKDIDLTFTTRPGPSGVSTTGDVYKKNGVAAVKQAMKTLLLTSPLEKPFEPDFGVGITELLFDLNDGTTAQYVEAKIRAIVSIYEPRAQIETLNIIANPNSNRVTIEIVFSVRNTADTFTFTTTVNRLR